MLMHFLGENFFEYFLKGKANFFIIYFEHLFSKSQMRKLYFIKLSSEIEQITFF